jgi:hypothetical protein
VAGAAVIAVAAGVWSLAGQDDAPPSAVIIDQLAVTDPNPAFVESASAELSAAGYRVDYVPWSNVTVDMYRELPRVGYDLIILRSHASGDLRVNVAAEGGAAAGENVTLPSVQLFTNESYLPQRHLRDQRRLALSRMTYASDRADDGAYFGIMPLFVRESMEGDFDGAIVILMGCDGLGAPDLADAFMSRGAATFVSWNGQVTAPHTDTVTEAFLREFLRSGDATASVASAMTQAGPDPYFASRLDVRER